MKHVLQKKTVFKRTTAVFLTLVMAFGLIPQNCLVVKANTPTEEWKNATSLPTTAGSYKLTDDVTMPEDWTVNAEIELDLNGCSIQMKKDETAESKSINVATDGKLTLKGVGAIDSVKYITVGGNLTVNEPNITTNGFAVTGTALLNDGTIKVSGDDNVMVTGKLTIDGATLDMKNSLEVSGIGELVVSDGYVTSETSNAINYANSNKITISGGYIKSKDNDVAITSDLTTSETTPTTPFISGGYFSKAVVGGFIKDGYAEVENADPETKDTYKKMVCKSTDSLPTEPGTYVLTADITGDTDWTTPAGATKIVLNGHSINIGTNDLIIPANASFVISDIPTGIEAITCYKLICNAGSELTVETGTLNVSTSTSLNGAGLTITGGVANLGEVALGGATVSQESFLGITGGKVSATKIDLVSNSSQPEIAAGFSWWLRSPGTIGNYYAAACVYDEGAGDDCQAQRS